MHATNFVLFLLRRGCPQVAVSLHNFPLIFRLFRRSFNGKFVALARVTWEQIGVGFDTYIDL